MKQKSIRPGDAMSRALLVSILSLLGTGNALAFSGGDGSPENPYQVATAEHLDAARNHLEAHFVQVADIDLGVAPWNEGAGWVPIGTLNERYSGNFDGRNFKIRNLTIDRPGSGRQGLFGYVDGAVIRQVILLDYSVVGHDWVGGLIGATAYATISDIIAEGGQVTGMDSDVGGVVGRMSGGSIERARVDAQVIGGNHNTGGVVGYFSGGGGLQQVCARGQSSGNYGVGGMVGYLRHGTVENSCSMTSVEGENEVGGLVGRVGDYRAAVPTTRYPGKVFGSYSTGSVESIGAAVGGFFGSVNSASRSEFGGCYWNTETSGRETSGGTTLEGIAPGTTEQMSYPYAEGAFFAWDFDNIWAADSSVSENDGYPYLRAPVSNPLPVHTLVFLAGTGGTIVGPSRQSVEHGGDADAVFAEAEAGAIFVQWSDGGTENPRQDLSVTAFIQLTAFFRSPGFVDLEWYGIHGITPVGEQTWADLDTIDWLGKGMSLQEEFLAGTDPADPQSRFTATPKAVEGTGFSVDFQPSLPERRYTLFRTINLTDWVVVPSMENVPGGNGPLIDANPPETSAFYRIEASLP